MPSSPPPPPAELADGPAPPERARATRRSSRPPAPAARRPLGRRLLTWAKWVALALALLAAGAAAAGLVLLRRYEAGLPSTAELKTYRPPQVTRILARDGTLLGELFTERRTVVPIEAIPTQMKLAALAAEDAGFYEHAGLDYLGMLRALLVDLRGGRTRQGGSTITQQVVKNVLLTPERTFDRKVREALLARRIETELSKDEILELYLNHIYFGHGRYGVEEAARFYFGKGVREVTLAEAAMLAGLAKGPGIYSPRVDLAKAITRRAFVLDQMASKGFARPEQVEAAKAEPLVVAPEVEAQSELAPEAVDEVRRALRELVGPGADHGGYTVTTTIDPALEAAARAAVRRNADDYAKRHKALAPLARARHEPAPFEGTPAGRKVYLGVVTGSDDAKNTLEVRVGTVTGVVDLREAARYNPQGVPASAFAPVGKVLRVSLRDPPPPRAAAEAAKSPADAGSARAPADGAKLDPAAGSAAAPPGAPGDEPADEARGKAAGAGLPAVPPGPPRLRLDLGPEGALIALDVRTREILALVGSYEGVRAGLDRASNAHRQPGSTFKAFVYGYAIHGRTMTPASIVETNPAALHGYRPDNYDEGEGRTPRRLREALAQSVNVAAVWTLEKVGAQNVAEWAHGLGVESRLGADLSLALGAYEVTPRELVGAYATFAAGGVYEAPVLIRKIVGPDGAEVRLPARPPPHRVMEEAEAYVLTSLLTSVVQEGTARRARSLGRPIAGKTGTSNQAKDAWFVGYSPDLACAVWTGFDDPSPLGAGEAGATAALPAFIDFMREAHKKRPVADFAVPPGVVRMAIDPETGLRAWPDELDSVQEVFLAGTEPTETATPDAGAPPDPASADAGAPLDAGPPVLGGTIPPAGDPPAPPGDLPPPF